MTGNCAECTERWLCDSTPESCGVFPDPVKPTNADRIRSMSDEEMVDFIDRRCIYHICDIVCGATCKAVKTLTKSSGEVCRGIIADWLKQPYEEDE